MQLKKLIKNLSVKKISGNKDRRIRGVASNSVEVKPEYMFVALRGSFKDGHDFIAESVERGAVAVVVEKNVEVYVNGTTCIYVDDTKKALSVIADNFYGNPTQDIEVIGITGTNGKTTVSYLIEHILAANSLTAGRVGTIDYSWGQRSIPSSLTTPPALVLSELFYKMREDKVNAVAMEVSSHSLSQKRVDAVQFDSCIFTNISRDHMDYHHDFEHYIASKKRLAKLLSLSNKSNKFLVINGDDKVLKTFPLHGLPCIFYGLHSYNGVYAENLKSDWNGVEFDLVSPWHKGKVEVPLFGNFNIYNVLAAVSWAGARGLNVERVIDSLKRVKQVAGRFQVIKKNGIAAIVDYAHSPDALKQVIRTARGLTSNRIITVFGCGGERDKGKRPIMGRIASQDADYTIVTSDNPRSEDPFGIIDDIKKGLVGSKWHVEYDREKAIRDGIKMLEKGDILLVAGKGHEGYQILKNTVIPFSDIEILKSIFNGTEN